jgi:hypothetical protein
MKRTKVDLPKLLEREKAVPSAVKTLIECLTATRSFSSNGKTTTEPDYSTRCKSALGLLEFASAKPKASPKDEPTGPKMTPAEHDAHIKNILGIE